MDIERERGITIKAQTVRLDYTAKDGEDYQLHLIDTPGHVDFNYEVSRSLAACEGALLVVDATQGVEAQTLANVYLALDNDLEIIPVLNKVDLPVGRRRQARSSRSRRSSASTARGAIAAQRQDRRRRRRHPRGDRRSACRAPKGDPNAPLRALIFDSWYDSYRGAVVMVRVVDGTLKKGEKIRFMATRPRLRGHRDRACFTPHAVAARRSSGRARSASSPATSRASTTPRSATRSRTPSQPRDRGAPRLQRSEADGLRRHLPDRLARSTRTCATRSRSCT